MTLNKLLVLAFIVLAFTTFSQDHLFYINQRFGVPSSHAHLPPIKESASSVEEAQSNKRFRLKYDIGTLMGYEYRLIKSTNTYVYAAFESATSRHDFNLNDVTNENIDVVTKRNAIHIGFRQRFNFWENQLQLGFGAGLSNRFYQDKQRTYLRDVEFVTETNIINWNYRLTTLHDGHHTRSGFTPYRKIINAELDAFANFRINNYIYMKLSFMYNRNHKQYYLLGYRSINQYINQGYAVLKNYDGYIGPNNSKYYTVSHHFYTSLGLEINIGKVYQKLKNND